MLLDLRFAIRGLLRNPGFTAAVVLALALGIGANTAIFSVVNAVVLRPLPYAEPERLVQIWSSHPAFGAARTNVSYPDYTDWRSIGRAFQDMGVCQWSRVVLESDGPPEGLDGIRVSANYLGVLGREPAIGRGFGPDDERPGAAPVTILLHPLAVRCFGSAREAVGQLINLGGVTCTVIGVMPRDFELYLDGGDLLIPLIPDVQKDVRGARSFKVTARLAPGVDVERARTELSALAARLAAEHADSNTGWTATIVPLQEEIAGSQERSSLLMLLAAVGFVLLIACVNVASLLLARGASRSKEIAVRLAVGARRRRIVRQLLTESLCLASLGAAAGVLASIWTVPALVSMAPPGIPRLEHADVDGRVLLYTLLIACAAGLVSGLAPALQTTRPDLNRTLKEGSQGASAGGGHRLLRWCLVTEVALSLVLLTCVFLMMKSVHELGRADLGFEPRSVLTARVALPSAKYGDERASRQFFEQALERIAAIPGVGVAAAVDTLPLGGSNTWRAVDVDGRPAPDPADRPALGALVITPGYFATMGIPVLQGRDFDRGDSGAGTPVVLVNQAMARGVWPDLPSPVGQRVRFGRVGSEGPWHTVIGVVGDVHYQDVPTGARPETYVALGQSKRTEMTLVVRGAGSSVPPAQAVREAVAGIDRSQSVDQIEPMTRVIAGTFAASRAAAALLAVLGGLALLLAAVGIYGVVSFTTMRRTREFGVRLALGARPVDLAVLVVRSGLVLTLIGVAAGAAGSLGVTRLIRGLLFGVEPADPVALISVAAVLTVVALLACYLPARRAARLDPVVALRHD